MKTAKFFWQYFKQYKLAFLVVMIMIIISTVLQVLFPIFTGLAISELVEVGSAFASGKLQVMFLPLPLSKESCGI